MGDSPQFATVPGRKSGTNKKSLKSKRLTPLEDAPAPPIIGNMTMSKSLQSRKELVEAVRHLNPAGLNTAPRIFWDVEGSLKTSTIDDSAVKQQLNIVENGVNYNARRYNDLKIGNERLIQELKKKLDELDEQKGNFESLNAMKNAQTEEAARIDSLQKEITEVETDIDRKIHYTRQLEHVLLRLKKNQLKFDAHMVGMEETMRNLQKEGAEVRLLQRSLDAGLAKATLVLEETKKSLADSRKTREVNVQTRRGQVKNAERLQSWLQHREEAKIALAVELRGDLTPEEENFLRSQISEKQEETRHLQRANEESAKKLQSMEDAFAQLKQVTGVSSLDEMLEKFGTQRTNQVQLERDVKEAEARLVAAKKGLATKEREFQDLTSSGVGLAELSREATDKLDSSIVMARNEYRLTKACTDRLSSVLLGLQQGSTGLLQRVNPYLHLADGGVFDLNPAEDEQFWAATLDALSTVEQVLAKMMETVAGSSGENSSQAGGAALKTLAYDDDSDYPGGDTKSLASGNDFSTGANNIRVKSKRFSREELGKKDDDSFEKDKGGGGGGGFFITDGAEEDGQGGQGGKAAGGKAPVPKPEKAPKLDRLDVPDRLAVKDSSAQTSLEAKRREEMIERRKKLQERMAMGNRGGGDDGGAMENLAQIKAQRASAERMCTVKSLPTLPEGSTLRDDVMTKAKAFLTKMPDLT